jgi:hypothetical protein
MKNNERFFAEKFNGAQKSRVSLLLIGARVPAKMKIAQQREELNR